MNVCSGCYEVICECDALQRIVKSDEVVRAYAQWVEEPLNLRVREDAMVESIYAEVPGDDGYTDSVQFFKHTPTSVPRWLWLAWEARIEGDDGLMLEIVE